MGARDDQALLFVLQLHVGAQGVDAGADAVLLQVGRLVVEGLRQIDARLGGLDIGGGALAAEVLRDHQQHALLANRGLLGARAVDAGLAGAIAAPEGQVEDRRIEVRRRPAHNGRARRAARSPGKRETDGGFQVDAVDGLAGVAADLRQQRGARDVAILFALRHTQVGENHVRILFKRQLDGVAQGELERRGILGKSAGGERQQYRNPQLHA